MAMKAGRGHIQESSQLLRRLAQRTVNMDSGQNWANWQDPVQNINN